MMLEFLGTAGYHPCASRHTSCAYITDASERCAFVLDAGTGFFRLIGRTLPPQLHIFLSHAHLDHVSGLTYLLNVLLHAPRTEVIIYGTPHTLSVVTNDLFDSPLFPLPFTHTTRAVEPGKPLSICDVKVSVFPLTHPGGSLAYRFDWPDKSLAYVTDTSGDGKYVPFIHGVDLLIHERNFVDELRDIADASGHCTSEAVARVAREAEVKRLIVTHFNPLETGTATDDSLRLEFPNVIEALDGSSVEF